MTEETNDQRLARLTQAAEDNGRQLRAAEAALAQARRDLATAQEAAVLDPSRRANDAEATARSAYEAAMLQRDALEERGAVLGRAVASLQAQQGAEAQAAERARVARLRARLEEGRPARQEALIRLLGEEQALLMLRQGVGFPWDRVGELARTLLTTPTERRGEVFDAATHTHEEK